MKKTISLLLIFCMIFPLCACGASTNTSAEEEGTASEKIVVESLEMRLTFDNGNPASIDDYDKFWLTARVTNLSEEPIENLSIKLRLLDNQGNELDLGNWDELISDLILPGETGIVERMNNVTKVEDIAKVQLVYYRCKPDMTNKTIFAKPYSYSIEEIFNVPTGTAEEITASHISLGESIVTDSAELIITGLSFTDKLLLTPPNKQKYYLVPMSDQVYAQIHFELTNLSKENHKLGELISLGIDYNEGFIYDMENAYTSCYICDDSLPGLYASYSGGGNYGGDTTLMAVPLTHASYTLCIPCPKTIVEDDSGLLSITASVESAGSRERYICTVRDENSSQITYEPT